MDSATEYGNERSGAPEIAHSSEPSGPALYNEVQTIDRLGDAGLMLIQHTTVPRCWTVELVARESF
jgi:hypothetical protein